MTSCVCRACEAAVDLPASEQADEAGPSPVLRAVRAAALLFLTGEHGGTNYLQGCIKIGVFEGGIAACIRTMTTFGTKLY